MQTIIVDRAANKVTILATGFWRPAPAEALAADLRRKLPELGAGLGRHALICDLTGSGVSPAETIEKVRTLLSDPTLVPLRARHVVFVSQSALARMQLSRLVGVRPGIAVTATAAEAHGWIEAQRAAELLPAD